MAVQQGDYVLEFYAPPDVVDELVQLYFDNLTQSQVKCEKQSHILRVSSKNEEAFRKISSSDLKIDPECRLTPFLSDSVPLLPTYPGLGEITENRSFACLSLHVESRRHITEYCLNDLETFLNDSRYKLHRTSVPGELLLEWHGPASERADQVVVRRIREYADTFSTVIVESLEQFADELRTLLNDPPTVDISCIKINQHCNDHLYMITCKKTEMSGLLNWLRVTKPVCQLLVVPGHASAGLERNLTARDLLESDSAAARTEMPKLVEPLQRELTSCAMTDVQSEDVTRLKSQESFPSDQPQSAFGHESPHTETDADQRKTHIVQGNSRANCETSLRDCPDSTFGNESALPLVLNSDPQQQEQALRRIPGSEQFHGRAFELPEEVCKLSDAKLDLQQQEEDFPWKHGNEQSTQLSFELSKEACNLSDAQLEDLWLAEQKSNGASRGSVNLRVASTMVEQLEHTSDDREIELWLQNEKRMGTKPGKVILIKEAVRSSVDNDSKPQREQRREVENEQQTVEEKSERDFRDLTTNSECSCAKPSVTSPEGYRDDCQVPYASLSVFGKACSITGTEV